jgi:hypothetical protein
MAWTDLISDIANRYSGKAGGTAPSPADPHQDFSKVAQSAPPEVTAGALAHVFRSDQTPGFPQMVSSLFRESDSEQRAGLLNRLVAAISPAALARIPGLSELVGGGQSVTPEQATQVSPEQVQQAAAHAQRSNPSIVDEVSGFYAQHPNVVKALGAAVITMALQHISRRG